MKHVFRCGKPGPAVSGFTGPAAILAIIAILLVTGCTGSDPQQQELKGGQQAAVTAAATRTTTFPSLHEPPVQATVLPSAAAAAVPDPSDPFERGVPDGILIRGIRETTAGDPLVVSGRTSLPAGTNLIVRVVPVIMKNGRIAGDYSIVERRAETIVTQGSSNGNRFSVTIDTTGFSPADHIASVTSAGDEAVSGGKEPSGVNGTVLFAVLPG
jgi:hypothetical protein